MGGSDRRSPLRRKLRAKVVDTILDAAERVADEVGLTGMTIAEVAARGGVAVGTLYNYFPDGDGIIMALFRARRAALTPMIAEAAKAARDLPFEHRLREFVRRLLVAFDQYERFVRVSVLADRDGKKSKPRDTWLMDETVKALEQIMRDGARRKRFPASRVSTYARMLHGTLRSLYVWRPAKGRAVSADAELAIETFLHGLGA